MTALPNRPPRDASEARLLANVRARSERLFEDGYAARKVSTDRLVIVGPRGSQYELCAGSRSCTCPFYTKHEGRHACKHLLGAARLLERQAAVLRHNRPHWEDLT